jgi:uncharacterized protein
VSVTAYHVSGPHIPVRESAWAGEWAKRNGLSLTVLPLDPLENSAIADNPVDRCYHCKRTVFTVLQRHVGTAALCDGTNTSDKEGYRPGLKALAELGVLSPLALSGLSKPDIRFLAGQTGMDRPDQAAQPCLFTRFNYGIRPTHDALAALDAAEEAVENVLRRHGVLAGNAEPGNPHAPTVPFRLRFEREGKAVLHLAHASPGDALLSDLASALQAAGIAGVPILPVETVSGYFDRLRGYVQ